MEKFLIYVRNLGFLKKRVCFEKERIFLEISEGGKFAVECV